jgi:hypothetical protein
VENLTLVLPPNLELGKSEVQRVRQSLAQVHPRAWSLAILLGEEDRVLGLAAFLSGTHGRLAVALEIARRANARRVILEQPQRADNPWTGTELGVLKKVLGVELRGQMEEGTSRDNNV